MPGTLAAALEAQAEMHDAAFAVTAPANAIAEEVVKPELGEMDIGEDFVAVRDSDISGSSDDGAGSDDGAVLVTSPKKRPATNAPCTPEKATRARTGRFTQRLLLPSTPPRQLFGSDPYVGAHISDAPPRIRTAAAAPRELGPVKVRIIHAQTDKATLQMNFSQDDTIRKVKNDIASAVGAPAAALMLTFGGRVLGRRHRHDYLHDEAVMTLGDYRVFQWLARFPDWVLDCDLMVDTPPELALTEDAEVTTADTDPGIARVVAQI